MKKFNIIVCCDKKRGIAKNGNIPWNLPEDLKFFKNTTTTTFNPKKQNAVIMGRKTYESLPDKYKPLPDRLNIVISNTLKGTEGIHIESNFYNARVYLEARDDIEEIFVIGGGVLYKTAMQSADIEGIYFTQIMKDFECDISLNTFSFKSMKVLKHGVSEDLEYSIAKFKI